MNPQGAPPRKDRLTLTQLAGYDDILTDALVDHVYYWTTIRKNRSKYNLTRGINQDDVTRILLHDLIVAKDLQKTEASLLELPGLRKFYNNLAIDREKENFKKHMRKYINIWNTDCPFEVSTTNRYAIVSHEAAVTARRNIKKGDVIKYLCGYKVAMTPEEESDLDLTRRDFSIVVSSRKKLPSLFLGPARFANHDCNANARLVTRGSDGMEVVAVRDIHQGDEITVTYGDHYFGDNNCECLCLSCEKAGRGGWPSHAQSQTLSETATPLKVETAGHYGLRSSGRHASIPTQGSGSMTPDFQELPPSKRPKTNSAPLSAHTKSETPHDHSDLVKRRRSMRTTSSLRNEMEPVSISSAPARRMQNDTSTRRSSDQPLAEIPVKEEDELVTDLKAALNNAKAKDHKNKRKRTFDEIIHAGTGDSRASLTPSSLVKMAGVQTRPLIDVPDTPRTPSNPVLAAPASIPGALQSSVSATDRSSPFSAPPTSTPLTAFSVDVTPSPPKLGISMTDKTDNDPSDVLSTAADDQTSKTVLDKVLTPLLSPASKGRPKKLLSALIPTIEAPPTPTVANGVASLPSTRTPGDYIRTPLLLGEKYSRWVDCHTCKNTWVQANGYLTRKECPRCERHSMLYGYRWPKTEKVDKGDDERVMDHRTVHRFITTEEEKRIKKRGRGLLKYTLQDNEDVTNDGDDQADEDDGEEAEKPMIKRTKRGTIKAKQDVKIAKAVGRGKAKEKGDAKKVGRPKSKGTLKAVQNKVVKSRKGSKSRKSSKGSKGKKGGKALIPKRGSGIWRYYYEE